MGLLMAAKKPKNWQDDSKSPVPPPLKKAKRPQKENRRLNYQDNKTYNRAIRRDSNYLGFLGSQNAGQHPAYKTNYTKQEKTKLKLKPFKVKEPNKKT
jgi:hypothetical protein